MDKAVEVHAGEPFRSEHARPFIERQIAGHQRRVELIALPKDIEDKLRANRAFRPLAKVIDLNNTHSKS